MTRFQVPYTLKEIPEVQEYLSVAFENSKRKGDLQDLYRRRYVYSQRLVGMFSYSFTTAWWSSLSKLPMHHLQILEVHCSTGRLGRRLLHLRPHRLSHIRGHISHLRTSAFWFWDTELVVYIHRYSFLFFTPCSFCILSFFICCVHYPLHLTDRCSISPPPPLRALVLCASKSLHIVILFCFMMMTKDVLRLYK